MTPSGSDDVGRSILNQAGIGAPVNTSARTCGRCPSSCPTSCLRVTSPYSATSPGARSCSSASRRRSAGRRTRGARDAVSPGVGASDWERNLLAAKYEEREASLSPVRQPSQSLTWSPGTGPAAADSWASKPLPAVPSVATRWSQARPDLQSRLLAGGAGCALDARRPRGISHPAAAGPVVGFHLGRWINLAAGRAVANHAIDGGHPRPDRAAFCASPGSAARDQSSAGASRCPPGGQRDRARGRHFPTCAATRRRGRSTCGAGGSGP